MSEPVPENAVVYCRRLRDALVPGVYKLVGERYAHLLAFEQSPAGIRRAATEVSLRLVMVRSERRDPKVSELVLRVIDAAQTAVDEGAK